MASPPPSLSSPPPLVWVTQGKTQHLAHLLLEEREGKALIRWESTRKVEWVLVQQVATLNLPPRDSRRRRQQVSVDQKPEKKAKHNIARDDRRLTAIHTTPKGRPTCHYEKHKTNDQRHCQRHCQRQIDETNDDDDVCSIDTQEDVVLANLVWRKSERSKIDKPAHTPNARTSTMLNTPRPMDDESYHEWKDTNGDMMIKEEDLTHEQVIAPGEMTLNQDECNSWEETAVDVVVLNFESPSDQGLGNHVGHTKISNEETIDATASDRTSRSKITYKSSAYVQNLAEICYTVMNDRRWRMGNNMTPLFGWEYGDDLNAIVVLSQMYQPLPAPSMQQRCSCLLCKDDKLATDVEGMPSALKEISDIDDSDGNDNKFRAINLYCRLFYRKGPWFRINDIYTKYYAPKRAANDSASGGQCISQNDKIIDEVTFQEALLSMENMLSDLTRLCNQGLLRTFHDEEECGKIAGSVGIEGNGVLLSADERRAVLEKLGGSKKKANTQQQRKSVSPRENEIWKQMSQQQSITQGFLSTSGQKNARCLLPVCPHVNHAVLSKLAMAVVMSASNTEYIPATILRAKLLEVKKTLSHITDQRKTQALNLFKLNTCYRLREAPLLALRRCCRLFLCATSGPGDMRGDGTNGWKAYEIRWKTVLLHFQYRDLFPSLAIVHGTQPSILAYRRASGCRTLVLLTRTLICHYRVFRILPIQKWNRFLRT